MELSKKLAQQFFEQLDFQVQEIPTSDSKRADLFVDDGHQYYIIEVKEKVDTGSQLTYLDGYYPNSDRKITCEPHALSNRIDGILKSGRKQLEATPTPNGTLKLLFIHFSGPNADMFVRRTLYTFYGVQDIAPTGTSGEGLNCVYFHNSFSYSTPSVDGLIVLENEFLQLCLNEYSDNCDILRNSRLAKAMGNAVYDPSKFDIADGKFVLRSSVSRTDENVVLGELERITGIKYHTVTLNRYNL